MVRMKTLLRLTKVEMTRLENGGYEIVFHLPTIRMRMSVDTYEAALEALQEMHKLSFDEDTAARAAAV